MNLEHRVKRLESLIVMHMPQLLKTERVNMVRVIQISVCEYYNLPLERMLSEQRPEGIVWPRQIAMSLAYELSHLSTTDLAPLFNRRDHGTILNACSRVRAEEASRTAHNKEVCDCRNMVKERLNL
jgi:chromosomal replication initiation ATPase DnaA